jgi:phosphate uptake regulator
VTELTEGHTVKGYDVDLAGLRIKLLEMGGLVLDQVQRSLLLTRRCGRAGGVGA